MSYTGDRMIEFEESNWDWLIDKFLEIKEIRDKWEDFIYDEFNNNIPEPPEYEPEIEEGGK